MHSFLKFFLFSVLSCIYLKSSSQVNFSSSNLPIVVIHTNSKPIVDDPKIPADMGIIWNGPGRRNSINDPKNNYNGKIAIEIRGSSSQDFPKKSYGFETRSNDLIDIDVSLLGLPEENDWILYAPYTDKTMIRDVLTYTLDASLGHYSPRCRFVELVLNGNYQGVYVLMEKIKRNKNRVNIAKLTTTDNSGADLTGGYIIKIDKLTGGGGEGWNSDFSNSNGRRTYYQFDYPKAKEITSQQKAYIQSYVKSFENSLYFEKYSGPGSYHEFINDSSFVDFMIINELSKNVDGYRLSSYLFKAKNGLLHSGPIWDFNLGYGNANYHRGWITSGFQYQADLGNDYWQNPFWWNKLIRDPVYVAKLKKRWTTLRKAELSNQRVSFITDSLVNLLAESHVRNYQTWPILGKYVWPNYYVGSTYNDEVNWLKSWIGNRLSFLDQNWLTDLTGSDHPFETKTASVYPNPFTDHFVIGLNTQLVGQLNVELFLPDGRKAFETKVMPEKMVIEIRNDQLQSLKPALYILRVTHNGNVLMTQKVMKSR